MSIFPLVPPPSESLPSALFLRLKYSIIQDQGKEMELNKETIQKRKIGTIIGHRAADMSPQVQINFIFLLSCRLQTTRNEIKRTFSKCVERRSENYNASDVSPAPLNALLRLQPAGRDFPASLHVSLHCSSAPDQKFPSWTCFFSPVFHHRELLKQQLSVQRGIGPQLF